MKNEIGIYDLSGCSNLGYKERIDIYKQVGFNEIALYLDDKYMQNNEHYVDIINYAKKRGLYIKQVHLDYAISNLICDENSSLYFDYLNEKAIECENLGISCVVVHASKGDVAPLITIKQLQKLQSVTKAHKSISFCFENVRNNNNLRKILSLNEPNIKMCYDLGHAHAYDNETKLLNEFVNQIGCSHLHNNFGSDEHLILTEGNIDYKPIVKTLCGIKSISNCIEAFPPKGDLLDREQFKDFVEKCYNSTKML